MNLNINISRNADGEILRRLTRLEKIGASIMAKQSEQAAILRAVAEQQQKALGEIRGALGDLQTKITDLEAVIANGADTASEELVTAVNAVKESAQHLDDVIPDVTPTPEEPTS